MVKIDVKPLSINGAFQGRRFKTSKYKDYEKEVWHLLPKLDIPEKTPLCLKIEVGFSSNKSDLSNILKCFEDILCKKYSIDDRWNYKIVLVKKIVKKGSEYLKFKINKYVSK